MNLTDIHDALTEIWRWAESGDTGKETALETNMGDFQSNLKYENDWIGGERYANFIGPLEEDIQNVMGQRSLNWNPFSSEELDAIRHYYGQKIALENENPLVALGAPLAHELLDEYGVSSDWWKESLYDLAVNAIATKDYYMDEGRSGTEFAKKLTTSGRPDDWRMGEVWDWDQEFIKYGLEALDRVPVEDIDRRDDDKY